MAYNSIVVMSQAVEIEDISDITVTSITADATNGDYYRDIRFFGAPNVGGTNETVLWVRIRSTDSDTLQITVPESEF